MNKKQPLILNMGLISDSSAYRVGGWSKLFRIMSILMK